MNPCFICKPRIRYIDIPGDASCSSRTWWPLSTSQKQHRLQIKHLYLHIYIIWIKKPWPLCERGSRPRRSQPYGRHSGINFDHDSQRPVPGGGLSPGVYGVLRVLLIRVTWTATGHSDLQDTKTQKWYRCEHAAWHVSATKVCSQLHYYKMTNWKWQLYLHDD